MASKVDPCLFLYKNVICMVYVYSCLFWACSQSYIDTLIHYFKEYRTSYNWGCLLLAATVKLGSYNMIHIPEYDNNGTPKSQATQK